MVQCMAFDCRAVNPQQRPLVSGLQPVIFFFWREKNEIAQTEQKGYRSQRNYWGSAYFSSGVDVGEELAASPGKYRIRIVYVFSTALRKENGNVVEND